MFVCQLPNVSHYKRITLNPLQKYTEELSVILDDAMEKGIITKKQLDCLLIDNQTIATFYMLAKNP